MMTRVVLIISLMLGQAGPALSQTTERPQPLTQPLAQARAQALAQPLIADADPFVGTENGGNIVPGAQVPFGFVHASPDTVNPTTAGYNSYENILGFSQTHVSGTGGASKYGNFLTTPLVGKLRVNNLGSPKAEEAASPGYYTVRLTRSDVKAELTATRLVAMHRYTYPASKLAHILIDASSVVQPETGADAIKNPHPVDCSVRVIAPNRLEGSGNFIGGWNQSPYTLHFSAEFDRPFSAFGTWRDNRIEAGKTAASNEGKVGAYVTFDAESNQIVQMKIAVSFISPEKARANLLREIPGWDFDAVRREAEAAWESALGQIKIEGGTAEQRKIFYTALYHSHYMPHDLTGENAWWDSAEPHYEDFYAIWDTFRTHFPLLTLIQPERGRDMLRSLVDTYAHTGWMPDSRIAGANGMTQGGSNGDVVVADALAKGVAGVDYRKAYEAMVKNAEVESPRPLYEGRELSEYKRLGYLSMNYPRSVSRTVEYAYDDFCLAQVAKALGHSADSQKYLQRSKNWMNVWNDETRSARPREADGRWLAPFAAAHFYPDKEYSYWDAPFYEGSGYIYGTYVPHDAQALINKLGDDERFIAWLDAFFANPPTRDPAFNNGLYNHNNEPDFLASFLYIHAGRPARTQERVRLILASEYRTGRGGLPGNDDSGAMSSWYVWGAIGLYPNAGQPFYYISSPLFQRSVINLGGGRTFVIEAPETSQTNLYVQSATLNGRALERSWLKHEELARGGQLLLRMGATPSAWGRDERPPSMSSPEKKTAEQIAPHFATVVASAKKTQTVTLAPKVHLNPPGANASRYAYIPFDVPPRAVRVSVSYEYERGHEPDANTIDIGLFDARSSGSDTDPRGFRGWSGGRRRTFFISRDEATPGYLPGRMPAGTWRVILGLYKVASSGVDVSLKIEIEREDNNSPGQAITPPTAPSTEPPATPRLTGASTAGASAAASPAESGAGQDVTLPQKSTLPQKVAGQDLTWWRGDLHMHTVHSDGDWTIAGLIASARQASLDFICITDHNTASHHVEIDRLRADSPRPLLLRGEEITTYGGHTNAWGLPSGTWIDFRTRPGDNARMSDIAAQAHRAGALISINHPFVLCGGCVWSYDASARDFDAIEVWNGPWDQTDETALAMWDKILQSGRRITAIASSDSHRAEAPIGQPTTHVAAKELSEAALLKAIGRGSVYLTNEAARTVVSFEAETMTGKRRSRWNIGDEIRLSAPGMIRFIIAVQAPSAPGVSLSLSLISDGLVKQNIPAKPDGQPQVIEIQCQRDSYYRLEMRDSKGAMLALTNPIYVKVRRGQ